MLLSSGDERGLQIMMDGLDGWVDSYRAEMDRERGDMDPVTKDIQQSMYRGPLSLLRNVYDVYKDNAYSALFGAEPKDYLEGNVTANLFAGTKDGIGIKYVAENGRFVIPTKDGKYVEAKNSKAYALDDKGQVLSDSELDKADDIVIEMETPDGAKIQVNYFDLVTITQPVSEDSDKQGVYLGVGESYLLNPWGEPVAKGVNCYSADFAEMDMDLRPVDRKSWSAMDSSYHDGVRVKRQPYTPVYDTESKSFKWMEPVKNPQISGGHDFEKREGVFKYLAA